MALERRGGCCSPQSRPGRRLGLLDARCRRVLGCKTLLVCEGPKWKGYPCPSCTGSKCDWKGAVNGDACLFNPSRVPDLSLGESSDLERVVPPVCRADSPSRDSGQVGG